MFNEATLDLLKGVLAFASIFWMFYSLRQRIVGQQGVVIQGSYPYAMISVNGQKWRAIANDGANLVEGDSVVVSAVKGLQLAVVSRKSPSTSFVEGKAELLEKPFR